MLMETIPLATTPGKADTTAGGIDALGTRKSKYVNKNAVDTRVTIVLRAGYMTDASYSGSLPGGADAARGSLQSQPSQVVYQIPARSTSRIVLNFSDKNYHLDW
jgi:hypothetical protein